MNPFYPAVAFCQGMFGFLQGGKDIRTDYLNGFIEQSERFLYGNELAEFDGGNHIHGPHHFLHVLQGVYFISKVSDIAHGYCPLLHLIPFDFQNQFP
jgi:hypothetical protein